ncbi:helix-turn-helix domain-containing protein [Streptomyces sp. NPDC005931]|uniref:helix-turn-helix domain-containing protein n=1 Tax=Streptomyces sp. NPDC005931 TaxID=3364737 RepID=UPI0036BDFA2B
MRRSPATPLPPPEERRRLREAATLTHAQLAARVGVGHETVRAWESGRTAPQGRKGEAYAKLLASLARAAEPVTDEAAGRQEGQPGQPVTVRPEGLAGDGRHQPVAPEPAASTQAPPPSTSPEPPPPPTSPQASAPSPQASSTPSEPAALHDEDQRALTPTQAFDALYAFCAPALARQAYLLTGRRELARESVERAFQLAWERWPEVARDPDPAGWVRAAAYEWALSPWHRFRPRYRNPEPPPADASDRTLLEVLLRLPPHRRRTLVLHDGVGLGLPETAAETEATTSAAAVRLLQARETVAARLPQLADPRELHERLTELASSERLRTAQPPAVRDGSERRACFWTRAAIAFTAVLIGTTALTLRTAPTRYEPPVPPGETVQGVPPPMAPGPLSERERDLRAKLRKEFQHGPQRIAPESR